MRTGQSIMSNYPHMVWLRLSHFFNQSVDSSQFDIQFLPTFTPLLTNLLVGIGGSVVFFLATALMGIFDTEGWVEVFFWVNLAIGTTLAAFTAVVQNMGMAMAGALGDKYVQGKKTIFFFDRLNRA